jgi:hypothetical protein
MLLLEVLREFLCGFTDYLDPSNNRVLKLGRSQEVFNRLVAKVAFD